MVAQLPSRRANDALAKLGRDISAARRARRFTTADFAERCGVSKDSVERLEKGDPGVRIGTLSMALMVLGELDRLTLLIDAGEDDVGLLLARENLPKRIVKSRIKQNRRKKPENTGDDGAW